MRGTVVVGASFSNYPLRLYGVLKVEVWLQELQGLLELNLLGARVYPALLRQHLAVIKAKVDTLKLEELQEGLARDGTLFFYIITGHLLNLGYLL